MLAGGTGLAPFLSMLDRLAKPVPSSPMHLVYGVTHDADLVQVDRLEANAAGLPGFTLRDLRRRCGQRPSRKGYVTEHLDPSHLNGGDVDVYLCGPPPMVDAVRRIWLEQDMTPASFHYEKFSPSGAVTGAAAEAHGDHARSVRGQGRGGDRGGAGYRPRRGAARWRPRARAWSWWTGRTWCTRRPRARRATPSPSWPTWSVTPNARRVDGPRAGGPIDVLVNNVGGTIWAKPFAEYAEAQIEAEIRRSLFPTLWCCRAVLPVMLAQGGGVIVNVSSVATRGLNRVPYAAAKGGVNAMTAWLAWEYAEHGIRVNAVAPGGTDAPPRRIPRNSTPPTGRRAWYQAGGGTNLGIQLCTATAPSGAGRRHPIPGVRRSVLHHRRDPARGGRRSGLTNGRETP